MSINESSRFSFVRLKSPYQELQDFRNRQANLRSNDELNAAILDKLSTAATRQISGAANLSARAALDRIQKATKVKQDAQAAKAVAQQRAQAQKRKEPPTTVTLSDGQVITVDPAIQLSDGSKLDQKAGILTRKDGTRIDVKTGQMLDVQRLSNGTLISTKTGLVINQTV